MMLLVATQGRNLNLDAARSQQIYEQKIIFAELHP